MSRACPSGKDVSELLEELARRAQTEGMSLHELARLVEEQAVDDFQADFEVVPGAMSDGAKRCIVDDAPVTPPQAKACVPVPARTPSLTEENVPASRLPPGVTSFSMWKQCMVDCGKYAKDDISYGELATSTLEDHRQYVKWALDNPKKSTTAAWKDLIAFLQLYQEIHSSSMSTGICFPNSNMTRRMKPA